ncbi:MAG: precorrin-3B C(17)-methyltransferase [Candidatus Methanomethylophilaceae archaeon]|nr:precorrin-3B C(17)-methyltransferase [Candidatus Methanomethylophilaceae archaeon]
MKLRRSDITRGKLYIIGLGPGKSEEMTFCAQRILKDSDVVIGYSAYINLIRNQLSDRTEIVTTEMVKVVERADVAVRESMKGRTVSIISSGDAGIYGMAGPVFQTIEELNADIDVEVIPGMTAMSVAASVLGAPLMQDVAVISLDLLIPLNIILKRVDLAGQGDFVIALYNPKSKTRIDYLAQATDILLKYHSPDTPVGIVKNAGRKGEEKNITTLGKLKDADVDMFCIVIVGNTKTYVKNGKMITPRGYNIEKISKD